MRRLAIFWVADYAVNPRCIIFQTAVGDASAQTHTVSLSALGETPASAQATRPFTRWLSSAPRLRERSSYFPIQYVAFTRNTFVGTVRKIAPTSRRPSKSPIGSKPLRCCCQTK